MAAMTDNDKLIEALNNLTKILKDGNKSTSNSPLAARRQQNEDNDTKVQKALDAQKHYFEKIIAEEQAEQIRIHEETLAKIAASNKSAAEKEADERIEAARYAAEQEKILNKEVEQEATLERKREQVKRQKIARDGLATYVSELETEKETLQTLLDDINAEEIANGKLSEERLKEQIELKEKIAEKTEKIANFEKAINDAKNKNVSYEQKLSALQHDADKRFEARKKNEEERDIELAALKAKRDDEEMSQDDYQAAVEGVLGDYNKAEEQANKDYGFLAQTTDADGNIIPVSGEDLKGSMGTMIGKGLSEGGGGLEGISAIIKSVDGIKNIISVVKAAFSGNPLGLIVTVITGIFKLVGKISKKISEGISTYENLQKDYLAKVNTRLDTGNLNNERNFDNILSGFNKVFGSSRYINQQELIKNLGQLAEQGIAYNLEQRTILATLSDRMVSTFDMLDKHLTNLTKLQQADMSIAQLGAESVLTEFLNTYFEDTSYLSDEYDSITETLTEALSQMNAGDAVEFNYNVQKWLGSLYSLGMTSGGVSKLAEGINALATGDVDYFNSNDSARVLFASAAGTAYTDALVNGLDASGVNQLLENIVTYLADIQSDTNNVTKQVKAGIFGDFDMSDLRAVGNLATNVSDIKAIAESNVTWEDAKTQVTDYLIDFAEKNTTAAIQASNLVENTTYSLGKNLVDNQFAYVTYKVGEVIGGTIGEAVQAIAKISNAGGTAKTLVNALFTADDSLKTSLNKASDFRWSNQATGNFFQKLLSAGLNSLGLGKSQSYWNLDDLALVNERGQAFGTGTTATIGVQSGISGSISTTFGNAVEEATGNALTNFLDSATTASLYDQATTIEAGLNNVEGTATAVRDINDLYAELFETQAHPIRVSLAKVESEAQTNLTANTYNVSDDKTHRELNALAIRVVYL